jgi:hypothetical protein
LSLLSPRDLRKSVATQLAGAYTVLDCGRRHAAKTATDTFTRPELLSAGIDKSRYRRFDSAVPIATPVVPRVGAAASCPTTVSVSKSRAASVDSWRGRVGVVIAAATSAVTAASVSPSRPVVASAWNRPGAAPDQTNNAATFDSVSPQPLVDRGCFGIDSRTTAHDDSGATAATVSSSVGGTNVSWRFALPATVAQSSSDMAEAVAAGHARNVAGHRAGIGFVPPPLGPASSAGRPAGGSRRNSVSMSSAAAASDRAIGRSHSAPRAGHATTANAAPPSSQFARVSESLATCRMQSPAARRPSSPSSVVSGVDALVARFGRSQPAPKIGYEASTLSAGSRKSRGATARPQLPGVASAAAARCDFSRTHSSAPAAEPAAQCTASGSRNVHTGSFIF